MKKNWLEWTTFLTGLLVTISLLVYLVAMGGLSPPQSARVPHVEVRLGTAQRTVSGFLVPVTVHNHGDETAENVQVEVTLTAGSEEVKGGFDIPFLPRRSQDQRLRAVPRRSRQRPPRSTGIGLRAPLGALTYARAGSASR